MMSYTSYGFHEVISAEELLANDSKYLSVEGSIRLQIDFVQLSDSKFETKYDTSGQKVLEATAGAKLQQDYSALFGNKAFVDCKIQTKEGKVHEAHRVVLAGK
jgi:hypothetical protein